MGTCRNKLLLKHQLPPFPCPTTQGCFAGWAALLLLHECGWQRKSVTEWVASPPPPPFFLLWAYLCHRLNSDPGGRMLWPWLNVPFSQTCQLTFPISATLVSHQGSTGEPHPYTRRTEATDRLQGLLGCHHSHLGCKSWNPIAWNSAKYSHHHHIDTHTENSANCTEVMQNMESHFHLFIFKHTSINSYTKKILWTQNGCKEAQGNKSDETG